MRAYVLTRYGGPDAMELRDVPAPQPRPGDVRIKVAAAGLNPVDFKFRRGALRPISHVRLPVVAGCEVAGTVEAVGPGPNRFAIGDRVYAGWTRRGLERSPSWCACSRIRGRHAGVARIRRGRRTAAGRTHGAPGPPR